MMPQANSGQASRRVVLISTYDLGRQPFGLASPAAWLRADGAEVTCLDLSCQSLAGNEDAIRRADLIAFYLPMHTAMRITMHKLERVRTLNPGARLCAYGLYAPMNAVLLKKAGVSSVLGGEFESGLLALSRQIASDHHGHAPGKTISLERQRFLVPDRSGLPTFEKYARLMLPDGSHRLVGYTEASRGCKHLCRHCPVVPVYNGKFRIVQRDMVLEDIARQAGGGAQHITFGDPDFLNGPTHAIDLVTELHQRFPFLTYDVTTKVEHLLKHAKLLPQLRETGCAFVTTAVESLDDRVLAILDKGHTREDFIRVLALIRETGLALAPTFVAFTPWITLEGYRDLLATIASLNLIESVAPVQLSIRLLIPNGSRLLELPEVQSIIGDFDETMLGYPWAHPDPRMDELQRAVEAVTQQQTALGASRAAIFRQVWKLLHEAMYTNERPPDLPVLPSRATIPYLTEPWYC